MNHGIQESVDDTAGMKVRMVVVVSLVIKVDVGTTTTTTIAIAPTMRKKSEAGNIDVGTTPSTIVTMRTTAVTTDATVLDITHPLPLPPTTTKIATMPKPQPIKPKQQQHHHQYAYPHPHWHTTNYQHNTSSRRCLSILVEQLSRRMLVVSNSEILILHTLSSWYRMTILIT
jgi:hypothetical protein